MTVPVSARNHNPLNLRSGQPYEGLAKPAEVDGFCNFTSAVFGFRAAFRNYITKFDRGVNTVKALISEWAPPSDNNDTNAYIQRVCSMTGFAPDEVIALKTWDVCSKVCYAQAVVEGSASFETYWTQAQMAEGAFRAGIADAPPPLASKVGTNIANALSGTAGAAAIGSLQAQAQQPGNSFTMTYVLIGAAVALAILGAALKPKTKTEG